MKTRVHLLLGYAVLSAALLSTACSGPSAAESALAPAALSAGHSAKVSDAGTVFPLVRGSFAIENRVGDGIVGTYTGTSTFFGNGTQTSSLTLQITGGSGVFAGAVGSLSMTGTGAFAGEGTFALDGGGEVVVDGRRRANLSLSLRGSSSAGCSATQQIAISQSAVGAMGRAGRVVATLSHVVENTGCSS